MKGKRKSKNYNLKEGSRAFRRSVNRSHSKRAVWDAMKQVIAEVSANHEKYIADFFGSWEYAASNLNGAADMALDNPSMAIEKAALDCFLQPYSFFNLTYFARLIDRFTCQEEMRFREVCERISESWQKFFGAVLVHHPDLAAEVERAAENRRVVQEEVEGLYLGDTNAMITPRWYNAFDGLKRGLELIEKGIGK